MSASTLNEQSKAKSNTSVYQSEHHLVADVARTRESYQDLASYFSEVDPDEPSTSATNTIVLSTSIFDRDVEGTEPSKTSRNSPPRCRIIHKIESRTYNVYARTLTLERKRKREVRLNLSLISIISKMNWEL